MNLDEARVQDATNRIQEALSDLDSCHLIAETLGHEGMNWRIAPPREVAEAIARRIILQDPFAKVHGLNLAAVRHALGVLYPWQSGPTNAKDAARFAEAYLAFDPPVMRQAGEYGTPPPPPPPTDRG